MSSAATWTRAAGDLVHVGVTPAAAAQLGEIVHFEPPEIGSTLVAGHSFGELESVKSITDLLSPIAGVVELVNEHAVSSPEQIAEAPEQVWLIAVRPASTGLRRRTNRA